MVEQIPGHSLVIEYLDPASAGDNGRLVVACLSDRQADGLSMIYSFFDPDHAERHVLCNFIIMDHILRARAVGLPYIYLGYWVKGSRSMAYKTRYRPIEVLGPHGWRLMPEDEEAPVKRIREDQDRKSVG